MALRVKGAVKRITASGGGTLAPLPGESYRITNIHCVPSTNDTFLAVYIDAQLIMMLRVKGKSGNHVPYPAQGTTTAASPFVPTIFDVMRAAGRPLDIPLEDDETLTISRYAEAGGVTVVYDIGDAGDFKCTDVNGSDGKVRRQVVYGSNAVAISAIGDCLLDAMLSTGLVNTFPVNGVRVPNGCKGRILGVAGVPSAKGAAAANNFYTTYLKMSMNQSVLFDPKNGYGLTFLGDVTNVATLAFAPIASEVGGGTAEHGQRPLILDPPLELTPADALLPYVTVAGAAAAAFAIGSLDVSFITEFERP
jgi:hypothetical protein